MKFPKYEVWKTGNRWYWHLKAGNGEILCVSQGYTTHYGAVRGTKAARRAAPIGIVKTLITDVGESDER